MHLLPGAVDAPGSEAAVVDGVPGREVVVRKRATKAATLEYVEDSIEDLASMVEGGRPVV